MVDNLAIISRVIQEHQTIRGHIKLVGDSISDQEALTSLTATSPDWIPGRLEIMAEKQKRLQKTMSSLDEGLKNHFALEEKDLPPLLGELFMRALVLDHREIEKALDEAKSIIADIKLESLNREELLSQESGIKQIVDDICQLVEEHAGREEVVLEMVQKVLEEKG